MDKPNSQAADANDKNNGLATRANFASESKEVNMIGRIHSDILFKERYMLNEVNLRMKLFRIKEALCLMSSGETYNVVIVAASLLIRKVKISPSAYLVHAKAFENGTT